MSALAQPVSALNHTNLSSVSSLQQQQPNNNSGYANGYVPQQQQSQSAMGVPTPFTQTGLPNGHAAGIDQGQHQYYWSNQQYPQH